MRVSRYDDAGHHSGQGARRLDFLFFFFGGWPDISQSSSSLDLEGRSSMLPAHICFFLFVDNYIYPFW